MHPYIYFWLLTSHEGFYIPFKCWLAINFLSCSLYQIEFDKQLEESQRFRKIQVGTASRSEKIRTYNFPQDRVTDHRIHYSTNNIQQFLNGGEPLLNMMAVIQEKSKYEILNEILQTFQNKQTLIHLQNWCLI